MGLRSWMKECGCKNVIELEWWDEHLHPKCIDKSVKFVFTPAQHWCRRGLNDVNHVLWGSWTIIGAKHRFFFAGDSGYCQIFKQIGKRYGPFDLAAIPIGAYEPRYVHKTFGSEGLCKVKNMMKKKRWILLQCCCRSYAK